MALPCLLGGREGEKERAIRGVEDKRGAFEKGPLLEIAQA